MAVPRPLPPGAAATVARSDRRCCPAGNL